MSADSAPLDPYQSPALPPPDLAEESSAHEGRPLMLSAVCVLCLVIGTLGVINGVIGVSALLAGQQLKTMFRPAGQPAQLSDVDALQQQIQDRQYNIQQQYFWPILVATTIKVLICLALAFAGLRTLSLQDADRRMLFAVCGFAILYEVLWSFVQFSVQYHSLTVVQQLTGDPDSPRPQQVEFMITMMKNTMYGVLVGLIIMQLLKISFYVGTMFYLSRPRVRALFHTAGS
jgi:hypothetical protein